MLLTIKQVAEKLNVSISLAYALVGRGMLASHRIGPNRGAIRVHEADLAAYLDSTRCRPTNERTKPRRKKLKHIRLPNSA